MLQPSPIQLLDGVAEVLAADVAPHVAPGPASEQLASAIAMVRRIARALPTLPAYLLADLAELTGALAALHALPTTDPSREETGAWASLPATLPSIDDLIARDLQLREALARHCRETAHHQASTVELLRSLNQREATLRLSPWER